MPSNNVIPLPAPEDNLQHQALSWVVRLNSGEASQGDRHAFLLWIQQDNKHRQAYFAARKLWRQMGYLDLPPAEILPADHRTTAESRKPSYGPRLLFAGLALTLVLVATVAVSPFVLRNFIADYYTDVGEIKTLHLSDGTTVYLNTDSMIAERYSPERRDIELLAGEAEFEVAHDRQRPFVVSAGNGKTRALGTRFVVNYTDDTVKVSVLENAVEISSDNHASVTIANGYQLEYGRQGLLDVPKVLGLSEPDAWRYGKLKFTAMPLRQVIAEIDRYLPGKILLANQTIAGHQVTGVFETGNLQGAVRVIANSLQLRTIALGQLLVVIY